MTQATLEYTSSSPAHLISLDVSAKKLQIELRFSNNEALQAAHQALKNVEGIALEDKQFQEPRLRIHIPEIKQIAKETLIKKGLSLVINALSDSPTLPDLKSLRQKIIDMDTKVSQQVIRNS